MENITLSAYCDSFQLVTLLNLWINYTKETEVDWIIISPLTTTQNWKRYVYQVHVKQAHT